VPNLPVSADAGDAVAPLAPGADDARSRVAVVEAPTARPPLGPGDDDPRSPAASVTPSTARAPLAPGELDGVDPHEGFVFIAPRPAGPGDPEVGPRQLTRVPLKQ
jgi:hypothetical protein